MSNARFRVGMVGAGNICEFHVAAVKKLAPDVELIGVADLGRGVKLEMTAIATR